MHEKVSTEVSYIPGIPHPIATKFKEDEPSIISETDENLSIGEIKKSSYLEFLENQYKQEQELNNLMPKASFDIDDVTLSSEEGFSDVN